MLIYIFCKISHFIQVFKCIIIHFSTLFLCLNLKLCWILFYQFLIVFGHYLLFSPLRSLYRELFIYKLHFQRTEVFFVVVTIDFYCLYVYILVIKFYCYFPPSLSLFSFPPTSYIWLFLQFKH